jgi:hypothetical protein
MRALGVVVMMLQEWITSPDGDFQDSHRPAKAKGSRDLREMNIGVFCLPFQIHS